VSGEPTTTLLVEKGIWKRANGRYTVRVRGNGGRAGAMIRKTFDTLKDAREFRNSASGKRLYTKNGRKIDWKVSGVRQINNTGYVPTDVLESRHQIKEIIANSPRKTVLRDGRKYTLVVLPDEVAS
jgi:hypothetical protein